MSTRKIVQAVRELMCTVRQSHAQIMSRVRHLEQTEEHDRICGCWTSASSRLRATVVKMNTGYQATVFRGTKCQEQMAILPFGRSRHGQETYLASDATWEKIQSFIPPRANTHPRGGGRKPVDGHRVMNAIFYVLNTGSQWNALNDTGLCPSSTAHDRFQKWVRSGLFHLLWEEGLLGPSRFALAVK